MLIGVISIVPLQTVGVKARSKTTVLEGARNANVCKPEPAANEEKPRLTPSQNLSRSD